MATPIIKTETIKSKSDLKLIFLADKIPNKSSIITHKERQEILFNHGFLTQKPQEPLVLTHNYDVKHL
ncbi:hypothetical protein [Halothiobacillus sp.]|uniref:hypothetical protein n=1 Tax=Halothiobacillus sp. TaxID=1891311 RepID=UPI002617791D|nr:hypothetical protein [Halothiobacillus sp.]MDD4965378.1 hypothetical protein [Halothiobacillus sp.]